MSWFKKVWKSPVARAAAIVVGGAIAGPAIAKAGADMGGTWGSLLKTTGDIMAAPAAAIGKGLSSVGLDSIGSSITGFTGEIGDAAGGWMSDSAKGVADLSKVAGNGVEMGPPALDAKPAGTVVKDDYGNDLQLGGAASKPAPASMTTGSATGDSTKAAVDNLKKTNPALAADAAAKGGEQGLIATALKWARDNPALLTMAGKMAMGYSQGQAQQQMINDQRNWETQQGELARGRYQANMNVSGVKIPGLVGQAINK